jgi:hypothetical protein
VLLNRRLLEGIGQGMTSLLMQDLTDGLQRGSKSKQHKSGSSRFSFPTKHRLFKPKKLTLKRQPNHYLLKIRHRNLLVSRKMPTFAMILIKTDTMNGYYIGFSLYLCTLYETDNH